MGVRPASAALPGAARFPTTLFSSCQDVIQPAGGEENEQQGDAAKESEVVEPEVIRHVLEQLVGGYAQGGDNWIECQPEQAYVEAEDTGQLGGQRDDADQRRKTVTDAGGVTGLL